MAWDDFNLRKGSGGFGRPAFPFFSFQLRQLTPQLVPLMMAMVAIVWAASGVYIVGPDEKGIVLLFGKHVTTTDPGLHWRWPYPFESVLQPKVTEVQRVEIGFRTIDPGPPARYADIASESLMLTGDENIIDIDLAVQYRIADPAKYLFNVRGLTDTVKGAAEASLREVIGSRHIDDALTVGKVEIQEETRVLLQSVLDAYAAGLQVVAVQLQDVAPPKQVIDAFKDVASAREDKVRLFNEANGYRSAIIPEIRGKVEMILREAEGYREEKVRRAQGDAHRFLYVLAEYHKAKDVTRKRLLLETLEDILPEMDKIIMDNESTTNPLPILPIPVGRKETQPRLDGATERR